jgi:hypothetical protein
VSSAGKLGGSQSGSPRPRDRTNALTSADDALQSARPQRDVAGRHYLTKPELNARFQELCELAGVEPRANVETGGPEPWELKDLRKTCATYYGAHVPESSVEILGHPVGGITHRRYAHRAPLAFKAIMTLPQPTALAAPARGLGGECPCCRRRFADAA